MSYVDNYADLVKLADQEFNEVLENATIDNFYEIIKSKNYARYLGRYYYNKSLSSVYHNRIIIVPKKGYVTQRLVYINPDLTGGTKVGVQAINITEQNGSIKLNNSGGMGLCSLRRFFDSLCNAFGISVDYSEVDVYSFCNNVLSNGKFEFIYNRETGGSYEINSVTFDIVEVLYLLKNEQTYFDEELVQAFANAMYDAGWFTTELDISTTAYIGTVEADIKDLTIDICDYYFKIFKERFDTYQNNRGYNSDIYYDRELVIKALEECKNRYPSKKRCVVQFEGKYANNRFWLYTALIFVFAVDEPTSISFTQQMYDEDENNKHLLRSQSQYSMHRIYARRSTLGDLTSDITHRQDTILQFIETPYYLAPSNIAPTFTTGSSINITTTEIVKKGITVIDNAKLPSGLNSLRNDYPSWYSKLVNITAPFVETVGETLRNVFNIVEYVPVTLIGGNLTRPTQEESQTGTVLLPDIIGELPEFTVKYLTPLPTIDTPISPDSPYYPENPDYPDYPDYPPTNPPIIGGITPTIPDNPIVNASNGLFTVYNPTMEQLNEFGGYLWGENIVGILQSIFQNPIDGVISLHVIYATPETGDEVPIKVGYLTSTTNAKKVVEQYINIDCGTVDVPEYYGNVLDYAPYTKAHIYLPFIGIREINVNEIMGSQVSVNYKIDVLTGSVYASISVFNNAISQVLYVFEGNGGVQLPLTGGNMSRILSGVISGIAFGAIGGGAIGAVAGATGGLLKGASVSKSGSIGANAGAMGIKKPYIMITYSQAYMANNYNKQYGYPSNLTTQLSACKGYTRVKEVHVENILVATQKEKNMIHTLLKQGVIIE